MSPVWNRRSVVVFFLIGFGAPWIGWTTLAITGLERPSLLATALFYTGDFMSVAGFVAAFVAGGTLGLRSLLRRCVQVRTSPLWILFALFLPLVWELVPTLGWAALHGGVGRVDPSGFLLYGSTGVLLALTTGPLGEEAGWRGFLQPRLHTRYSPITLSLILGVIWSVWHVPLYWDSVFASAGMAVRFTIGTICFSALMTVLWGFTRASVFWAVVFHWSVNISGRVVDGVLPDVRPPEGATVWWEALVLILVTGTVLLWVGRERLEREVGAAMDTLGSECVQGDRVRPG